MIENQESYRFQNASGYADFLCQSHTKLAERIASMSAQREELFLKLCILRFMPRIIYRAIELKKPHASARWIEKQGYHTRHWPDGKLEFAQTQTDGSIKILDTLQAP